MFFPGLLGFGYRDLGAFERSRQYLFAIISVPEVTLNHLFAFHKISCLVRSGMPFLFTPIYLPCCFARNSRLWPIIAAEIECRCFHDGPMLTDVSNHVAC